MTQQPNTVTLTLTPEEAEVVLQALSQQPYATVAALIHKILGQANTAQSAPDLREVVD